MNNKFTEDLGNWLQQPQQERDYAAGAKMLFQLTGNAIMYRNMAFNPARYADRIDYELKKFYFPRLQEFTHQQVEDLQKKADAIAQVRRLDTARQSAKSGKRVDHDALPEEVQKLYVDNLDILHKMRDIHTRLKILSEDKEGKYCPDSDRYPFLRDLVSLDIRYRDNWSRYDSYEPDGSGADSADQDDAREKSLKALRLVNLNKGRYRKQPSTELAAQIRDWYAEIISPPSKLSAELQELGIL